MSKLDAAMIRLLAAQRACAAFKRNDAEEKKYEDELNALLEKLTND